MPDTEEAIHLQHFSKEWYRSHSDRDRKLFESILFLLIPTLTILFYTLTKNPADDGYYKMHSALFVCSVMIALLFVIRKSEINLIVKNTWFTITNFRKTNLAEIVDAIFFLCGIIFIISMLFVIDLDFMSNYGIRIGGVVALGIAKALRTIFFRR